MNSIVTEDVSKLPKWAQYRVSLLERNLKSAQDQLDAYGGVKTNIEVDPYSAFDGRLPHYLPDRVTVEYSLEHGSIQIDLRDGELRVSSEGRGQLVIEPATANAVSLKLIKDL